MDAIKVRPPIVVRVPAEREMEEGKDERERERERIIYL